MHVYNILLSYPRTTPSQPTALLNDVVAADSSEEDPNSSSSSFDPTTPQQQPHPSQQPPSSLPRSLAQWLGFPSLLYLGITLLLLLVGLCLGEPEGRVAVGVLLAAVLRCVSGDTFTCLCVYDMYVCFGRMNGWFA